ncbi:MAG: hypothetical protein ACKO23_16145, partial [Gemmataceae bacterium]
MLRIAGVCALTISLTGCISITVPDREQAKVTDTAKAKETVAKPATSSPNRFPEHAVWNAHPKHQVAVAPTPGPMEQPQPVHPMMRPVASMTEAAPMAPTQPAPRSASASDYKPMQRDWTAPNPRPTSQDSTAILKDSLARELPSGMPFAVTPRGPSASPEGSERIQTMSYQVRDKNEPKATKGERREGATPGFLSSLPPL